MHLNLPKTRQLSNLAPEQYFSSNVAHWRSTALSCAWHRESDNPQTAYKYRNIYDNGFAVLFRRYRFSEKWKDNL